MNVFSLSIESLTVLNAVLNVFALVLLGFIYGVLWAIKRTLNVWLETIATWAREGGSGG